MVLDIKITALGSLILLLGLAAGYTLNRTPVNEYINPDLTLSLDKECELNQASCTTNLADNSSIEFSITPRPIQGISPLSFSLTAKNLEIEQAIVDLSGIDMNMGSYRYTFEPTGEDSYAANGNLPVCVRGQMLWQADVWLDTKQKGLIKVPFMFSASKP